MRLYLVRHGKTDIHLEKKRQTPQSPLGEYGLEQARVVGKRLKTIDADVLLSSNWPRAVQTAEIISKVTGLPVNIYPDLHEQETPKAIHGILDDSELNLRFLNERLKATEALNYDWKFEGDGESLNELLIRVKNVCNTLATEYKNKKVIAVTHGVFIAVLIVTIIFGFEADKRTMVSFFKAFRHHNTGISILDYDEDAGQWSLVSLNDHSHIA